jgi:hypothetical protein
MTDSPQLVLRGKSVLKQIVLTISMAITSAHAFNGSIGFTNAERDQHARGIDVILKEASDCLEADYKKHLDFYKKHGISAFYGDRSSFAKMNMTERKNHLKKLGKNPELATQMGPTSCIGLTLNCLNKGFAKAGQSPLWNRIAAYTKLNNQYGNALQHALQELGWKIVYWNPNTSMNEIWDEREKAKNPTNSDRFWGWHSYRYLTVTRNGNYYQNKVDDAQWLLNFGTKPPANFSKIPFFVGTAHTGYHVFPGSYGQIIEGHSTRAVTDYYTIESSPFNPLQPGGGPRGEYKTGLMAIPPVK